MKLSVGSFLLFTLTLFWHGAYGKDIPCSMLANPEMTLAYLNWQVSLSPQSAEAYTARAFFLLKENKQDQALKDLDKVIDLEPNNSAGYLTRGLVYSETGLKEKATADFLKACSLGDASGCSFSRPSPKTLSIDGTDEKAE